MSDFKRFKIAPYGCSRETGTTIMRAPHGWYFHLSGNAYRFSVMNIVWFETRTGNMVRE